MAGSVCVGTGRRAVASPLEDSCVDVVTELMKEELDSGGMNRKLLRAWSWLRALPGSSALSEDGASDVIYASDYE